MCFFGCGLPFAVVRQKTRDLKGIEGDMCNDLMCVACCGCCAMIQVKR